MFTIAINVIIQIFLYCISSTRFSLKKSNNKKIIKSLLPNKIYIKNALPI